MTILIVTARKDNLEKFVKTTGMLEHADCYRTSWERIEILNILDRDKKVVGFVEESSPIDDKSEKSTRVIVFFNIPEWKIAMYQLHVEKAMQYQNEIVTVKSVQNKINAYGKMIDSCNEIIKEMKNEN